LFADDLFVSGKPPRETVVKANTCQKESVYIRPNHSIYSIDKTIITNTKAGCQKSSTGLIIADRFAEKEIKK